MEFRFASDDFAKKQRELLKLEYQAEEQEAASNRGLYTTKELEAKGIAINKVKVVETSSGLYGKLLIYLESAKKRKVSEYDQLHIDYSKYNSEDEYVLPPTKLGPGDIVGIFPASEHLSAEPLLSGVIYKQSIKQIVVAVDKAAQANTGDLYETHLAVLMLPNDITYKRCLAAVEAVGNPETTEIPFLWEVLLELQAPRVPLKAETAEIIPYNLHLNDSQISAIQKALMATDLYLIHGPPGTGKTTTIVEYILQEIARGNKVLACGPSNMSVDNMVEKLIATSGKKARVCRIGHPARMLPQVWQVSLDALVDNSEEAAIAKKNKAELNKLLAKVVKTKDKVERKELRVEIKQLKKDIKKFEKQAVETILSGSNVVLATNTGIADKKVWEFLKRKKYVTVIDEAAQAIEASCWIPIQLSSKLVLAGDHKQLAPTIKSVEAGKKGLEVTLFERLMKKHPEVSSLLDIQYRMNNTIMGWTSAAMYQGKLKADESVADSSLKHKKKPALDKIKEEIGEVEQVIEKDMLLIDTAGCQFGEAVDAKDENDSKYNIGEVSIVIEVVKQLKELLVSDSEIGIITPYNAQVQQLRKALAPITKAEISTVDGFQGREKEVILISMVRSNPEKKVGFLADQRRMNVAITRAKTFVAIVCDSTTVSSNDFLGGIVQYITKNGQTIHAKNYSMDPDFKYSAGAFIGKREERKAKPKPKKKKAPAKPPVEEIKKPVIVKEEVERITEKDEKIIVKEKEEHIEKLCNEVDGFMNSDKEKLEFPETLTAYDRLQLHKYVSERYKEVIHGSEGDGPHRRIVLKKPAIEKEEAKVVPDIMQLLTPEQVKKAKLQEEERKKREINALKKKRAKERKAKREKEKKEEGKDQEKEEDIEATLNKMIRDNKLCSMEDDKGSRCTNTTEIFGRVCQYCSKQFCLQHIGPSIHKCPMTNKPEKVVKADPAALKAAVNDKLSKLKALRAKKIKKK